MEKLQECVNKIQSNLDEMKKLLEPQKKEGDLDIIKSVKELILDENYYFIPEYQRGYKWDENNINALLNDIAEYLEDKNNDKKFYSSATATSGDFPGKLGKSMAVGL